MCFLISSRPKRGLNDLQGGDARIGAKTRRQRVFRHLSGGQRDRTLNVLENKNKAVSAKCE